MLKKKDNLIALMEKHQLDAIILVPGANQYFLTGAAFHVSERPTLISVSSKGNVTGVIPFLEKDAFESLDLNASVFYWQDNNGYNDAFLKAFGKSGYRRIGVEGQSMRVFECNALKRALPDFEVIDFHRTISGLRLNKDPSEIQKMKKAIEISENALNAVLPSVKTGMNETRISAMLLNALFECGADGLAFSPIVATGGNSANPHAHPETKNLVRTGDALLIDFGATYQHYNADITRTFFVGNVSDNHANMYQSVLKANRIGINSSKAGVTAHVVDNAVQNCLESSDFKHCILHKTGHGLGLDVHENPQIMRGNHEILTGGNVVTIEPGLYQKDQIGIRIEDDVLITENGCDVLTAFPKDLQIIGV